MSPLISTRERRMKMSELGLVPSGVPASFARNCVWSWRVTLSVAPSIGIGTFTACDAADASRRRMAGTSLQEAFICERIKSSPGLAWPTRRRDCELRLLIPGGNSSRLMKVPMGEAHRSAEGDLDDERDAVRFDGDGSRLRRHQRAGA